MKELNIRHRRHYNDFTIGIGLAGIITVGLAFAIKKIIEFITRKVTGGNVTNGYISNEKEILDDIRSGKLTEQKYVYEVKFSIIKVINNFYRQGALDDYFDSHEITPSNEMKYIANLRNKINKCKTIKELINVLDSESSPVASSYFDLLEPMDMLFKKAKTMHDNSPKRYSDGIKDIAKKLINSTKEYIEKFKQIGADKKLIVVMLKIQQLTTAISVGKDLSEVKKYIKSLSYWKNVIDKEREKNPDFEPSINNPYIQNKVKITLKGISVVVKLLTILLSNLSEKYSMNIKNNKKGDSMVRYNDFNIKESAREIKIKIDKAVEYLKNNLANHPGTRNMVSSLLKISSFFTAVYSGFIRITAASAAINNILKTLSKNYYTYSWPGVIGLYLHGLIFGKISKFLYKISKGVDKLAVPSNKNKRFEVITTHDNMPWSKNKRCWRKRNEKRSAY